jgi:two-component system secretion response regulator SsrB
LPWGADEALDTIRHLRERIPAARVIAFAAHGTAEFIRAAFAAGTSGLLAKDDEVELLADAVRQCRRGEPFYSPRWRNAMLSASTDSERFDPRILSPREWDVIALIAESRNSSQIAKELGIETTTVQAHRANIMKKLGIHKAAGLVRWYDQHEDRRPGGRAATAVR